MQKKLQQNENKPIMLECGDAVCSFCIQHYKEATLKDEIKCPHCCNMTKSMNRVVKQLIPKDGIQENITNFNRAPAIGEFEVMIRTKDNEIFPIKVTKEMTVGKLKDLIYEQKGYNKNEFDLAFRKPLIELGKTLEFYKIIRKVTLTQISNVHGGR